MRAVRDNSVARFKSGKDDLTAAVGIAEDDPLLLRLIAFSQQPDIRAGRIMQYGTQRDAGDFFPFFLVRFTVTVLFGISLASGLSNRA